jgi:hypothetical protein
MFYIEAANGAVATKDIYDRWFIKGPQGNTLGEATLPQVLTYMLDYCDGDKGLTLVRRVGDVTVHQTLVVKDEWTC